MKYDIRRLVATHGVDRVMIMYGFRPTTHLGLITLVDSSSPSFDMPAKIVEKRFKIDDGYKVEFHCTQPGFETHKMYQTDFNSLWREGRIKVFVQQKYESETHDTPSWS